MATLSENGGFPVSAGILFGLGLGGFFDGIVLHQILQWHHMLTSAGYPADSVENLKINTFWDGLFHGAGALHPVAPLAEKPYPLVREAPARHLPHGLRHLQSRGGHHRPLSARHPPRQRDGGARAMDLLGCRFPTKRPQRRLGPRTSRWSELARVGRYHYTSPLRWAHPLPFLPRRALIDGRKGEVGDEASGVARLRRGSYRGGAGTAGARSDAPRARQAVPHPRALHGEPQLR